MKLIILSIFIACMACNDSIPDQDAVITVDVSKDSTHQYTQHDCSRAYDTTLSTLSCRLVVQNGEKAIDKDIYLYQKKSIIKQGKTTNGSFDFGWLEEGNYSIKVGHTDKYPCIMATNIIIPNGRGCELTIKLPSNH